MIQFIIDPSLTREAILNGRQLLVTVESPTRYRVTLAGPSPYKELPALAKGRTRGGMAA